MGRLDLRTMPKNAVCVGNIRFWDTICKSWMQTDNSDKQIHLKIKTDLMLKLMTWKIREKKMTDHYSEHVSFIGYVKVGRSNMVLTRFLTCTMILPDCTIVLPQYCFVRVWLLLPYIAYHGAKRLPYSTIWYSYKLEFPSEWYVSRKCIFYTTFPIVYFFAQLLSRCFVYF